MNLVSIILIIIFSLCTVYSLAKNEITHKQHIRIIDAIFAYNTTMIYSGKCDLIISYEHIEPYDKTFFRLWDWGYTRMVPPDILEKIEPYIKSAK